MNGTPPPNKPSLAEFNYELLASIARITPDDIDSVRKALLPVLVRTFDEMPKMEQWTIAALYQRRFEDLAVVARSNIYFTGVHKINNDLNFLMNGVPELTKKWSELK